MIRIIYSLATKQVASVLFASDGETTFNQQIFGMLQGDVDTIMSLAIAINIDVTPVIEFLTSNGIDISLLYEKTVLLKNKHFGQGLLLEFFTGTTSTSLPNAVYRQVTDTFYYAETALRRGDISQAKIELESIEVVEPIWSSQVKQYFIDKITTYLAQ